MTEIARTVQLPVSLPTREQIAEAMCREQNLGHGMSDQTVIWQAKYLAMADAVLTLLSKPTATPRTARIPDDAEQLRCAHCGRFARETGCDSDHEPTPTAEPTTRQRRAQEVIDRNERDRLRSQPVRIEDLALGTTLRFGKSDTLWTLYYNATFENYYVVSPDGSVWQADDIDPSTIRDVTRPAGA